MLTDFGFCAMDGNIRSIYCLSRNAAGRYVTVYLTELLRMHYHDAYLCASRGTVPFMSPELFESHPTPESDMWAMSCVFVEVSTEKNTG